MSFLGLFGPPKVEKLEAKQDIEGLIKALGYNKKRKAFEVQSAAVEALVRIGSAAVKPLCEALRDDDYNIRDNAIRALGQIGDVRAIEPLLEVKYGTENNLVVRALGQIGDPEVVTPLTTALSSPNKVVRIEAAKALGKMKEVRAVGPLISMLSDTPFDKYSRSAAMKALNDIGASGLNQAITTITRQGADKDLAMELLAQLDPNWMRTTEAKRAVPSLISMLKRESTGSRNTGARLLGEIGDERAIQPLIDTLPYLRMGTAVEEAAEALGNIGDARAVMPLLAALGVKNEEMIRKAIKALERVVDRSKSGLDPKVLNEIAKLPAVLKARFVVIEANREVSVDCSRVKQIAQQELVRRGLDA
ncbi:MAG: HEAT repeat domain-containing protein [Anaerolineae bacterium]